MVEAAHNMTKPGSQAACPPRATSQHVALGRDQQLRQSKAAYCIGILVSMLGPAASAPLRWWSKMKPLLEELKDFQVLTAPVCSEVKLGGSQGQGWLQPPTPLATTMLCK